MLSTFRGFFAVSVARALGRACRSQRDRTRTHSIRKLNHHSTGRPEPNVLIEECRMHSGHAVTHVTSVVPQSPLPVSLRHARAGIVQRWLSVRACVCNCTFHSNGRLLLLLMTASTSLTTLWSSWLGCGRAGPSGGWAKIGNYTGYLVHSASNNRRELCICVCDN